MKVVRNIGGERARARDYFRFDIASDEKSGRERKENKKRRRILHLMFDASLEMKTNYRPSCS